MAIDGKQILLKKQMIFTDEMNRIEKKVYKFTTRVCSL